MGSGQNSIDHFASKVGESEIAPRVTGGELFAIEPGEMENGGVEVVNVDWVLRNPVSNFIALALEPCRRLAVQDLELGYGRAPSLISELSFEVKAGEVVALMGPSGSGKSTILERLAGLRSPRGGCLCWRRRVGHGKRRAKCRWRCPPSLSSGLVFSWGTVRENLLLGRKDDEVADPETWNCLKSLDLAELLDRGLNMSEGQRYRLTLARALLARRSFLLLDEPVCGPG